MDKMIQARVFILDPNVAEMAARLLINLRDQARAHGDLAVSSDASAIIDGIRQCLVQARIPSNELEKVERPEAAITGAVEDCVNKLRLTFPNELIQVSVDTVLPLPMDVGEVSDGKDTPTG